MGTNLVLSSRYGSSQADAIQTENRTCSERRRTLAPMHASVTTRALAVHYGERIALSGLDLEVSAPSTVAVIGPNGSGKSTLLGVLAGLVTPSSGSATVAAPSTPALVLQSTTVDRSLPITVRETVSLARLPRLGLIRRRTAADRRAVDSAMERLDVADLADRQLHELSGGQRQRVFVAQGLAQESDVLLLDEPVTGLDMVSRTMILEVIDQERAAGHLVMMTTHSLDDAGRCDHVLLLATEPVAYGTPTQVLTDEHLRAAFGNQLIRLDDGLLISEGLHHDHGHHDHGHHDH